MNIRSVNVITGNYYPHKFDNKVTIYNLKLSDNLSTVYKTYKFVVFQLFSAFNLIKMRKDIDITVFHIGTNLVLPMIISKVIGKKSILIFTGSSSKSIKKNYQNVTGTVLYYLINIMEHFNLYLANRIVTYSDNIISDLNLDKKKVSSKGATYVDDNIFHCYIPLDKRETVIGYIGRFSNEKGVLNFVDAISNVMININLFYMIGNGGLSNIITTKLNQSKLSRKVKIIKWVPKEEVPKYLNIIKLLVIPSYTEAGPRILLEAMSCGTIVLSTPVGIVPDVIKDGENGFIMQNNSPKTIANNIERVLNNKNLIDVSSNAIKTVKEKFTFNKAIENYNEIIKNI